MAWYLSVNYLPLTLQASLARISTVLFTAITASLIEGERFTCTRAVSICFGFTGLILMIQPEFIFGDNIQQNETMSDATNKLNKSLQNARNGTNKQHEVLLFGTVSAESELIIGICLAIMGGLFTTCMERKVLADFCLWTITFWAGIIGIIFSGIVTMVASDIVWISDLKGLICKNLQNAAEGGMAPRPMIPTAVICCP